MPRPPQQHGLVTDLRKLTRMAQCEAFTLDQAAKALRRSHRDASRTLSALAALKAVRRLVRGVYIVIPAGSLHPRAERPRSDMRTVAALMPGSYIGGWTAAKYWGLLSRVPNRIFVVTTTHVRKTRRTTAGIRLHMVHVPKDAMQKPGLWPHAKATISDPERTLVDALGAPSWIGGALALADALEVYRNSRLWDVDRFLEVLEWAGSTTAMRRLGAISAERNLGMAEVVNSVHSTPAKGLIDLEPGLPKVGKTNKRWRVRMNVDLEPEDGEEDFEDRSETIREGGALWACS